MPEEQGLNTISKIDEVNPQEYRMKAFQNPRIETNRKTEIVKSNPFDQAALAQGVTMSINGRSKGTLEESSKTLRDQGKVRYTREDYLKMVNDRSMKNLAMSKYSTHFHPF